MKKGKRVKVKIRFSNRWFYTFIAFGILIVAGISVYATSYTGTNTGHPYTEITTCAEGQFLKVINGVWTCENYFASKDDWESVNLAGTEENIRNTCHWIGIGGQDNFRDSRNYWVYGAYSNIPYYESYSPYGEDDSFYFICPEGKVLSGVKTERDGYQIQDDPFNRGYGPITSYSIDNVQLILCC